MWRPQLYRIVAGVIDMRALDDEGVAFVRTNIQRLHPLELEIDTIEDQVCAMGRLHRAFGLELLLEATNRERWVVTFVTGKFTCRPAGELRQLAARLAGRADVHYRLPAHGYTVDRLAEVEAAASRRDPADVPALIEYLELATLPTPSEQALRHAIYDALSWHQLPVVHDLLLRALATEPDDVAGYIIETIYRQESLVDELPALIDEAWRAPRDERLATRLLAALVKSDDDRKHDAWARAHYPSLLRKLGM